MSDEYTRERVKCNLCGSSDESVLFRTPERIVQCRQCGLIYTNPRLDLASLQKMYAKEYFVIDTQEYGTSYKAYANYIGDEPVILRSMLRRMRKVEKYAPRVGMLLDVGCATGFSLLAAQQRGWQASGVEFSDFCVDYARSRGLDVFHGLLQALRDGDARYDAITMWDYLEHSADPLGDLKQCQRLLKPGGVVVLSVPNVDSWSYALFKQNWIGFKNNEHFYFFSRSSMGAMASQAGLRLEADFYHGKYVGLYFFLSRAQYYVQAKSVLRMIDAIANRPVMKRVSFYFNPFDILNVVLRKD